MHGRQIGEPTPGRSIGTPSPGRSLGQPTQPNGEDSPTDPVGNVLAFAADDDTAAGAEAPTRPNLTPSKSTEVEPRSKATTGTNGGNAQAATTTTKAKALPSTTKIPGTSAMRSDATSAPSSTARAQTTTTKVQTPATVAKPSTTLAKTTTTKAPAQVVVPASNGTGCSSGCQTVGFQDLRGKSNVVLANLVISNPNGRCIDLTGARNITIRNVTITNCGTDAAVTTGYDAGLIHIEDADAITIDRVVIDNMSAERFGAERNNAIHIRSSTNVTVSNSLLQNIHSNIGDKGGDRGNRAIKVEGASSQIQITANRFINAGRNAVQIGRVRNAPGIAITNNTIEGRGRWDSDYEDMINLYSSSGTASSPIRIAGNTLRNGGPSTTGTGMILGDGNIESGPTSYVIAENNLLIDPGHVGINLAGGENITIRNNRIIGTGDVPHKTTTGFTINHYGYSSECKNHVVTGNRVWMDNQHLGGGTNHHWNPGTCTDNVRLEGNVFGDASLLG